MLYKNEKIIIGSENKFLPQKLTQLNGTKELIANRFVNIFFTVLDIIKINRFIQKLKGLKQTFVRFDELLHIMLFQKKHQ